MGTLHITGETFESQVLKAEKPVLVDFWAQWCGPCRAVAPVLDELAGDYEGRAFIGKVNVDEQNEIAQRYKIMSIPTVIVFNKGQIVEKVIGARTKKDYAVMIDKYL
jgi:thioredoxin 1